MERRSLLLLARVVAALQLEEILQGLAAATLSLGQLLPPAGVAAGLKEILAKMAGLAAVSAGQAVEGLALLVKATMEALA